MKYKYILRYYIDPGFKEDLRIPELIDFCKKGDVAEVMFFYNPEELFGGYLSDQENQKWLVLAKKVKKALSQNNIDMSLNPWTTTVHVSRGRTAPDEITGQKLVGETGTVSPITACPFSKTWQKNLASWFAQMAKETHPVAIWIEDDWRLHNHEPEMKFGGCFCPIHMKKFSESVGKKVTREELLHEIVGKNNLEWRKKWLAISNETMIEPAQYLEKIIHQADPTVRLGLMCSTVDTHSIEGRDWMRLKKAFSPTEKMLLRPHLSPYTENYMFGCYPSTARATAALYTKDDVEIYPELENSPRSGVYSKSATASAFEMFESIVYGSKGITINHFDMMGNGIALDVDFSKKLAAIKPQLDTLVKFGAYEENAIGIEVLFSTKTPEGILCEGHQDSLKALTNKSFSWSTTFGLLGISHRITCQFDSKKLTAVSDQTLRAFSDTEILAMLKGRLLFDGKSVEILIERGFGKYIGIEKCTDVLLQDTGYAYEEIVFNKARMSASRCALHNYKFENYSGKVLSKIMKFDRTELFPGMHFYQNELGGRILSSCYPMEEAQFYMGYFNNFRRDFLQAILTQNLQSESFACALDRPFHLFANKNENDEYLLSIINATIDPVEKIRFQLFNIPENKQAYLLDKNGSWNKIKFNKEAQNIYTVNTHVNILEGAFIKLV